MRLREIHSVLMEQFPQLEMECSAKPFHEFITVPGFEWYAVAGFLKSDPRLQFDSLMCLSVVDLGVEANQMEVIYNLFSMSRRHKATIKITGSRDGFRLPSVETIWRTADWHEREAYDLFGVVFDGHRNLRRILLPDDWEGFPLKKDYRVQEYYHGIRVPKVKPKKLTP